MVELDKMVKKHFKMERTPTLEDLIRLNDYPVAYNLKEAYNHILVHPSMRDLLGIMYKGVLPTVECPLV
jgi:hypothetical protein